MTASTVTRSPGRDHTEATQTIDARCTLLSIPDFVRILVAQQRSNVSRDGNRMSVVPVSGVVSVGMIVGLVTMNGVERYRQPLARPGRRTDQVHAFDIVIQFRGLRQRLVLPVGLDLHSPFMDPNLAPFEASARVAAPVLFSRSGHPWRRLFSRADSRSTDMRPGRRGVADDGEARRPLNRVEVPFPGRDLLPACLG